MKRSFLVLTVSFLAVTTYAQSFGLRAGVNLANVNVKTQGINVSPDTKAGINAGAFINLPVSHAVSIQPELAYSGMGFKLNVSGTTGTESANYLTLPVLVKVKVPKTGLGIYAGPQYGLLLSAREKSQGQSEDVKDMYKSSDFAGVAGVEYGFKSGLFFTARYQFGLVNIAKSDPNENATVKNNCVSIMAGFRF